MITVWAFGNLNDQQKGCTNRLEATQQTFLLSMHTVICTLFERPRHAIAGDEGRVICWFPAASCGAGTRTSQGAGRARRAWTTEFDIAACGKYHSVILRACRVRSCFFFPWRPLRIRRKELYCAPAPEERRTWLSTQQGSMQCQYANCS